MFGHGDGTFAVAEPRSGAPVTAVAVRRNEPSAFAAAMVIDAGPTVMRSARPSWL
jgi:hypothetical protein